MDADPLSALADCCADELLQLPAGGVLFLNGRAHPALPPGTVIQQHFKPWAAGAVPDIPEDGAFGLVMVLGSKQREETLYFLGCGLSLLAPGGVLVCAAANDAGGRRLKGDFAGLGLDVVEISRHKSRVIRVVPDGRLAPEWVAQGGRQTVAGGACVSQPGLFGWDRVDAGSALLAGCLPDGAFSGLAADFGCGYGYLSVEMKRRWGDAARLFCIDADARAVRLCRENAAGAACLWADLTAGVPPGLPPLDLVVMNPPFHQGKRTMVDAGEGFIRTACAALRPGGALWMVANVHLPYEAVVDSCFSRREIVREENGFKVIHATK